MSASKHFTPIGTAIIQKPESKCWRACGETGFLARRWEDCKTVQPLWKTVGWFFKK